MSAPQKTPAPAPVPVPAAAPGPAKSVNKLQPLARSARPRARHWGVLLSFLLLVVAPLWAAGAYLYSRAVDQYASTVAFSVQKEEFASPIEMLGGIADISGSSSSDTDILYEFIQSQKLVETIDQRLDLRALYSKPERDPVFSFDPDGSIEDLVDYWGRMVKTYYDAGTGLIELRVLAFDPEDARQIAQALFEESSSMINRLSAIARDDTIRFAQDELNRAENRLKTARQELTRYRSEKQIIDPDADIQVQMGLLNTLQQELAGMLVETDLLRESTRADDPRLTQADRRIAVIRARISSERQKLGVGGPEGGDEDYATVVAEFERLTVDRQFAEQSYTTALTAYDAAQAEARRQSRYLAAYIEPTLAESSQYPQREILLGLSALFLFFGWSIMVLIYYSIRDRR